MNWRSTAAAAAGAVPWLVAPWLVALWLVLLNVPGAAAASTARTARTASTARTARTGASGDAWGTAEEVPGIAALNKGGIAFLDSVSCASAGNCGTGGYYLDRSGHQQVFAVGETKGTWGTAREVPGTAALNQGGYAYLFSVSCPSAGDCGAGGYYSPKANSFQAFVVGERDGTWGTAAPVPHLAALNTGADAAITGMSCASAGNCTAGGFYTGSARHQQAFVVVETKGTWQRAQEVPGTAALNAGGFAEVYSVSCPSAGNCGAGGYYTDSSGRAQAFVAGEVKGRWGSAVEVPGTAALNTGGLAQVNSVSCASPGNCSAGGDYTDGSGHTQVFVVSEVNGTWRNAEEVPGSGALNQGGVASLSQVSCQPSGNCSAGGSYSPGPPRLQAFVASKVNGTWRKAEEVPGSGALDSAGIGGTISVSCPPSGNCSAGGFYTRRGPHHANVQSVFVVTETNGCSKRLGPGA
jgi:hypothetical protein